MMTYPGLYHLGSAAAKLYMARQALQEPARARLTRPARSTSGTALAHYGQRLKSTGGV